MGKKLFMVSNLKLILFYEDFASLALFIYNIPVVQRVPLHKHLTTDELFFF